MVLTNYYGVFVSAALAIHAFLCWRSIPWSWVGGAALAGAGTIMPWFRMVLGAQVAVASDRVQPTYFSIELSTTLATINRFSNGAVSGVRESRPLWTFRLRLFASADRCCTSWHEAGDDDPRPRTGARSCSRCCSGSFPLRRFLHRAVLHARWRGLARLRHRIVRAAAIVAIVAYSGSGHSGPSFGSG
jgi:hypothetical protein